GPCSSIRVPNLTPGTGYSFTVSARNAAGTGTAGEPVQKATLPLYGIATCINGTGDQATYCDSERTGRNCHGIFSVTRQDDDLQDGWVPNNTRMRTYCKAAGEEVYAFVYNDDKRSTWWIRVDFDGGQSYIPWAWLNLEGGDNINLLPNC